MATGRINQITNDSFFYKFCIPSEKLGHAAYIIKEIMFVVKFIYFDKPSFTRRLANEIKNRTRFFVNRLLKLPTPVYESLFLFQIREICSTHGE